MTADEFRPIALRIMAYWPGAKLGRETLAVWCDELAGYRADTVNQAVRSLKPSAFVPSLGQIEAACAEVEQGSPPGWDEARRFIARTVSAHSGSTASPDLGQYVRFLTERSHEVVARFAADVGLQALRTMPDDRNGIDGASRGRLRDLGLRYAQVVEEWRADPQEGLAVARARPVSELRQGNVRRLSAVKALDR